MLAELYYRLSVLPIRIPPLRERKEDIPHLAAYFLQKHAAPEAKRLSPAALAVLQVYDFPGNVRELEYTLLRAVHHSAGPVIEAGDIELCPILPTGEAYQILEALRTHRFVSHAAEALGMARSTFYAKIKKFGLPLKEASKNRKTATPASSRGLSIAR